MNKCCQMFTCLMTIVLSVMSIDQIPHITYTCDQILIGNYPFVICFVVELLQNGVCDSC